MRNAGRVVSKTMILSHVWDYSFDPRTNVVDVLVFRLREKIDKRLRPQADPDRPRHRLCPQSGVSGCATRSAFRLALWYAVIFVASSLVARRAHLSAARASLQPVRPRDHPHRAGAIRHRLSGAAASPGCRSEIQRDAGDGRARAAVRARGRRARRTVDLPQPAGGLGPASTCRGSRCRSADGQQTWSTLRHRRRRRRPRSRLGPAARRHAVPGRQEHRAPHAAAGAVPPRAPRQRPLARSSSASPAARC